MVVMWRSSVCSALAGEPVLFFGLVVVPVSLGLSSVLSLLAGAAAACLMRSAAVLAPAAALIPATAFCAIFSVAPAVGDHPRQQPHEQLRQ